MERNSYCSLFLLVLRCFTSQGSHQASVTSLVTVQNCRVSPFGYLRIKGYKPPPRSFSQVSRVLHSRPRPRHPPCTLMSLVRRPIYHNHYFTPHTRKPLPCVGLFYFAYSYVKDSRVSGKERTARSGSFAFTRAGLTAYPLLKV